MIMVLQTSVTITIYVHYNIGTNNSIGIVNDVLDSLKSNLLCLVINILLSVN